MTDASSISPELNAAYNGDYAPSTDGRYALAIAALPALPLLAEVAPIVAGSYEAYSAWYGSSAAYTYFGGASISTVLGDLFVVNGPKAALLGFTTTSGGQYITSGFDIHSITVTRNILTSPFGGYGGLMYKSSFQERNGKFRFSSLNEFALDFSFGKISDGFGSKIKLLNLPQFSSGVGTFMESILIMGSKASTNTVKKELKNEFENE